MDAGLFERYHTAMTNVVNPERDAPIDHMKIHKDVVWVIRTLWGGAVAMAIVIAWAVALASDVEQNSEALEKKVDQATAESIVSALNRIEGKIDKQAEEQKTIRDSVIRLETKVEKLEEDIDE